MILMLTKLLQKFNINYFNLHWLIIKLNKNTIFNFINFIVFTLKTIYLKKKFINSLIFKLLTRSTISTSTIKYKPLILIKKFKEISFFFNKLFLNRVLILFFKFFSCLSLYWTIKKFNFKLLSNNFLKIILDKKSFKLNLY